MRLAPGTDGEYVIHGTHGMDPGKIRPGQRRVICRSSGGKNQVIPGNRFSLFKGNSVTVRINGGYRRGGMHGNVLFFVPLRFMEQYVVRFARSGKNLGKAHPRIELPCFRGENFHRDRFNSAQGRSYIDSGDAVSDDHYMHDELLVYLSLTSIAPISNSYRKTLPTLSCESRQAGLSYIV